MRSRILLPTIVFLCLYCAVSAGQQVAPDASLVGPLPVASGEYNLGAYIDNLVLPNCQPRSDYDCKIAIRAKVYRPQTLSGTYPLIIFLHGNHATCGRPYMSPPDPPGFLGDPRIDDNIQYTGIGTCPPNYIEAPSYIGYEYLAKRLASYGYIVVSVNANRGITGGPSLGGDSALIKARGILIMRHLQKLSSWNRHGGTPPGVGADLRGHLDFTNVGMMGHSRGGDGVRAAYNDYVEQGSIWPGMIEDAVTFKGIFEIAPTDFLNKNSKGVVWNVLLGMCDGDVFDLRGVHPYDRDIQPPFEPQPLQKSTYTVWGANHNFFNTQWQVSDGTVLRPPDYPSICVGTGNDALFTMSPGSPQQRLTTMSSLLAFFRANVGSTVQDTFNRNFNSWWGIPSSVTDDGGATQPYPTRVDRGFTPPSSIKVFEDFTGPTGTSSYGFPNLASNIQISHGLVPNHDTSQRAGIMSWTSGGSNTYFQTNWTAAGSGADMSSYTTLEIRVSRQSSQLNTDTPTDFSIRLIGAYTLSSGPRKLSSYIDPNFVGASGDQSLLQGPVGTTDGRHPILQTVRIPLADFPGWPLVSKNVHGIRLTFDQNTQGAIYVANIRLSTSPVGQAPEQNSDQFVAQTQEPQHSPAPAVMPHTGSVLAVRAMASLADRNGVSGVEIEISSAYAFPVRDNLLTLSIGSHQFGYSRYGSPDLHRVVFSLTNAEFAQLSTGDPITVHYGARLVGDVWTCGQLSGSR